MVRVDHGDAADIDMDYVNQPESSTNRRPDLETRGNRPASGIKVLRVVAVGFGILCILQAALNVSLRLTLYKPQPTLEEAFCRNETQDTYKLKQQTMQYLQKGWLYFHESLYYISSTKKTWNKSREHCQQQGADLVIINNKEEQDLARQFNRLTWIGLHDLAMTGDWTWVDGAPLTTRYWGPGEPTGLAKNDPKCVEIRFFEHENSWNDIRCETENFWICEKEAALRNQIPRK